jgi:hypothetical protein
MPGEIVRNPEGVARFAVTNAGATPSELRLREMGCAFPGLPKRNPGLELANAFSVIPDKSSQEWVSIRLFMPQNLP